MASQSEVMRGPAAARTAPSPNADMGEHAEAHGRVVIQGKQNPNFYVEVTPPVVLPAPPDTSARGRLAPRVEHAEAMVAHAAAQHAAAVEKLVEAQRHMITATSADRWVEQGLLEASGALTLAKTRLDAFTAHRDALLAHIAAWEADGSLDAYDDACLRQSGDGLMRALEPEKRVARKLGGDFGAMAVRVQSVVGEIMTARQKASALAAKLGFTRHRDSGIDVRAAAVKISAAFVEGFKAAAPRLDLKRWLVD